MKLIFFIIILLLLSVCPLNGQIAEEIKKINADSLSLILPSLEGIEKIDALNKIDKVICI